MTLAVCVPLQEAQETLEKLRELGVLNYAYKPRKEEDCMYFAVTKKLAGYDIVEVDLEKKTPQRTLKEALAPKLTAEELGMLKTAYDLVGDIAIMEIDEDLRHMENVIGKTLLEMQPAVKTVVRKDSGHEGELRLQDYVWLAGEKRFETTVTENGLQLTLDIRKTYYSVRSATERMRIASLIRPNERVLVMFSGIAPFVCTISKHSEANEVVGVELNKSAHKFAQQNIGQNALVNASVHHSNVRKVVPTLGVFDRIPMPLPHTAQDFLDIAVPACNKGAMIHLYHFSSEEDVQAFAKKLPARIKELGREGKVEHIQKCGNLGPGIHRWSIDIKIE